MNPSNLPSPRYILVHATNANLDANNIDPKGGHAFGPFDTYEEAEAFDRDTPEDECYRFAFPLVGPEGRDMLLTGLGLRLGAYPAMMALPPRQPRKHEDSPLVVALRAAHRHALEVEKQKRKAEKKAAKKAKADVEKANAQDDGR